MHVGIGGCHGPHHLIYIYIYIYIYIIRLSPPSKNKIQMGPYFIKIKQNKIANLTHHISTRKKKEELIGFIKTLQIFNISFVVYCCANKLLAITLLGFVGP